MQPSHAHNQRWHGTPSPSSSPSEVAWRPWSQWAAVGSSNECCIVTVPWSAPAVGWDLRTKRVHIAWKRNFKDAATVCLICRHFEISLILRVPWKPAGIGFSQQKKDSYACLSNPQSIDPPTHSWHANRLLQTRQENVGPRLYVALFYSTKKHKTQRPLISSVLH